MNTTDTTVSAPEAPLHKLLDFKGLQKMNADIYGVQNRRHFEKTAMISRAHRYVTIVLKGIRKERHERLPYDLCMALSWLVAFANELGIDLAEETWQRYTRVCPYCKEAPCTCGKREWGGGTAFRGTCVMPSTVGGFQKMFADIYPGNTLRDSAMHLAEEIGELDEAWEQYKHTHDPTRFTEIVIEFVDVIANLFAVATLLKIDIAKEMMRLFRAGCPKCLQPLCECGYTVAKSVPIRA